MFSNLDVVEPDLLYLSNERAAEIVTPQHVRGAPELVVEIGSPETRQRDETSKRRLYDRSGVAEYWVIDPELDVIPCLSPIGCRIRAAVGTGARERRRADPPPLTSDL